MRIVGIIVHGAGDFQYHIFNDITNNTTGTHIKKLQNKSYHIFNDTNNTNR
jgi:hypothetical protein